MATHRSHVATSLLVFLVLLPIFIESAAILKRVKRAPIAPTSTNQQLYGAGNPQSQGAALNGYSQQQPLAGQQQPLAGQSQNQFDAGQTGQPGGFQTGQPGVNAAGGPGAGANTAGGQIVGQDGNNLANAQDSSNTGSIGGYSTTNMDSPSSGHFMAYFLTAVVLVVVGYVVFHNKSKIVAFIIEGRNHGTDRRRRPNSGDYKKIKTNVDEVIPALDEKSSSENVIY